MKTELTTVETSKDLGLLEEEYNKIGDILGRMPNFTELCIFSVMWSEHCSYKNSIAWLKKLPRESERMLAKAGEENAGLVDIGDGLACSFKIESHNHPSAIEPYQGTATGVRGINRLISSRHIQSAHDVSDGGLFVALAESAMAGGTGFRIKSHENARKDAFLFGEGQGRIVVTLKTNQQEVLEKELQELHVPFSFIGRVGGNDFVVDEEVWMGLEEAKALYNNTLASYLN